MVEQLFEQRPEAQPETQADARAAERAMPPAGRFFLGRHRVVNAGAGTGKTHALLTQYLHLLCGLTVHRRPLEPRAICALTFTEKAAGELRERLGRRLRGLLRALAGGEGGVQSVEPELHASAVALGRGLPPIAHFEAAQAQLSAAPIGTFHSFAAALLRRHAVAGGLDPDFTLLDEDTARDLLEETSERVVLAALEGAYADGLAAATAGLVAEYGFRGGARSEGGLVEALCQLYWVRAEEGQGAAGLAAAYTPEALERERLRLRRELGDGLRQLGVLADELGGKSAERAATLAAAAPDVERWLDRSDEDGLLRALPFCETMRRELGLLRAPKDKDGGRGPAADRLAAATGRLKRAGAEVRPLLLSMRAAPLAHGLEELLAAVAAAYGEHKRRTSVLDFSDLLARARQLLRDVPTVQAAERRRYAALLVDEFQDTSPLQAELLRLLVGFMPGEAAPDAAGAGESEVRRLYLVGDRKQSIYGFRGADVTAYERLCQELIAAGADEETLAVSRRSRPALIAGSNTLFSRVFAEAADSAIGQVVWDGGRDALRPFRPDPEGADGQPLFELLRPATPPGDPEAAASVDDPMEREAALVAARITAHVAGGGRYGDVVLLLRRFTHLLRYTAALKLAGIPHYVVRGRGFYQAQEVLDLAAFFTLLDDPEDRLALLAVLRSPLAGLSDDTLARLHLASRLSLPGLFAAQAGGELPRLLLSDEAARLGRLLGLLGALGRAGDRLGPLGCLQALLDETDYLGVLWADPDGEQRVGNVLRLGERARSGEAAGVTLRGFVRALVRDTDPRLAELRSERDEPTAAVVSEGEDVVRVMTVHQSKGLEFPVVIVAGCASLERTDAPAVAYDRLIGLGLKLLDGGERLPTLGSLRVRELARQRGLAESGRLFYVAATRAKERLCFTGELRPGRRPPATSWMASLESLRADAPALLGQWQASPLPGPARGTGEAAAGGAPGASALAVPGDVPTAERQAATVYRLGATPAEVQPTGLPTGVLSLAAATDLAVCPRRYHLRHVLRLLEYAGPDARLTVDHGRGRDDDPPGGPPLGRLGAEILDELLETGRREHPPAIAAQLSLRGQDPRLPAVGELSTRLGRFLDSRAAAETLTGSRPGRRLFRALPYDVALWLPGEPESGEGARGVRLRGRIDLVVLDGDAQAPRVTLGEYRYGYQPDAASPWGLERVRQLLLGLVGGRLFRATELRLAVAYLRESDPQPRVHPVAAAPDAAVVERLARAAPTVTLGSVAALRLPVLPQPVCEELGCGYQYLCFAGGRRSVPG